MAARGTDGFPSRSSGSPEFTTWRRDYTSWFQVPIVYVWNDLVAAGSLEHGAAEPIGDAPVS